MRKRTCSSCGAAVAGAAESCLLCGAAVTAEAAPRARHTAAEIEGYAAVLHDRCAAGEMSRDQLLKGLGTYRFDDEEGRVWCVGQERGSWFVWRGGEWARAEPPAVLLERPVDGARPAGGAQAGDAGVSAEAGAGTGSSSDARQASPTGSATATPETSSQPAPEAPAPSVGLTATEFAELAAALARADATQAAPSEQIARLKGLLVGIGPDGTVWSVGLRSGRFHRMVDGNWARADTPAERLQVNATVVQELSYIREIVPAAEGPGRGERGREAKQRAKSPRASGGSGGSASSKRGAAPAGKKAGKPRTRSHPAFCPSCGVEQRAGKGFCHSCGVVLEARSANPEPDAGTEPDAPLSGRPGLAGDLARAMEEQKELLAALEAGRISAEEFQKRAVRAGIVIREQDAWVHDLEGRRWLRYDGVAVTSADEYEAILQRQQVGRVDDR